jgi:opacity protein-like surface antigen
MKRNAFVLSLSLVFAVIHTQAQGFHLGIKAGANLFKIDGESFSQDFNFGYCVGAFSQIYFTPNWGIQPELMFNQTNYRTGDQFSSIYPNGVNDVKGKLNYLSIPVLLSFRPIPFLSLLAGPQFGIMLNQDEHLVNNAQQAFKSGDVSLVGGAQLNLMKFMVGARYVLGLNNVNNLDDGVSWKNQGWQVYAGIRIF